MELQGPEGEGTGASAGENGAPKKGGGRGKGRMDADPAKLDSAMESYWNKKGSEKSAGEEGDSKAVAVENGGDHGAVTATENGAGNGSAAMEGEGENQSAV